MNTRTNLYLRLFEECQLSNVKDISFIKNTMENLLRLMNDSEKKYIRNEIEIYNGYTHFNQQYENDNSGE